MKLNKTTRIIVIGSGTAGSEIRTYLGQHTTVPLEIVEIEVNPERRFGGWGFQTFPDGVTTNLALRKMYLGEDPEEILQWISNPNSRKDWPEHLRELTFHPDKPVPRALIQLYVKWRRRQVRNPLVSFKTIHGEAMNVSLIKNGVQVTLASDQIITSDRLVMASGSIAVKIPPYLERFHEHENVIIDPLCRDGFEQRKHIQPGSRVLILGTGLTGEEQALLLLDQGITDLTMHSRSGYMHYAYPEQQEKKGIPHIKNQFDFLMASTPEEFDAQLRAFYQRYEAQGYTPEEILAALRPDWDKTRKQLGGCVKAAERLHPFRRSLAVNSIGTTFESSQKLHAAIDHGSLQLTHGKISSVVFEDDGLNVSFDDNRSVTYDWIINAIGRNIIRHPIWRDLLADGLAKKHAGIGVRVNEYGQMMNDSGNASSRIWVVGMARAGDHALRHGYLGNLAFNLPQVRAHVYETARSLLAHIS